MSMKSTGAGGTPEGQWLLEGGDDPWDDLVVAIDRCLDEVVAGGVLEVISWVPGIERDIAAWCADIGHELLHILQEGGSIRLWIKKGDLQWNNFGTTVQ